MDRNRTMLDETGEIEIRLRENRSCCQGVMSLRLANVIFDEYGRMDDPRRQSFNACAVLRPGKQANLMNSDINPVIGKKRRADCLNRVFVSGDREKNDPLGVQCIGVSESVKSFGLDRYQNTGSIMVPARVVSPLRTHLHLGFSVSHSFP